MSQPGVKVTGQSAYRAQCSRVLYSMPVTYYSYASGPLLVVSKQRSQVVIATECRYMISVYRFDHHCGSIFSRAPSPTTEQAGPSLLLNSMQICVVTVQTQSLGENPVS